MRRVVVLSVLFLLTTLRRAQKTCTELPRLSALMGTARLKTRKAKNRSVGLITNTFAQFLEAHQNPLRTVLLKGPTHGAHIGKTVSRTNFGSKWYRSQESKENTTTSDRDALAGSFPAKRLARFIDYKLEMPKGVFQTFVK